MKSQQQLENHVDMQFLRGHKYQAQATNLIETHSDFSDGVKKIFPTPHTFMSFSFTNFAGEKFTHQKSLL